MGLDTSHDCFHGPYSAFFRWRNKVAEVAGYSILPVVYEGGSKMDTIMIDWGHVPDGALMGEWGEVVPNDPLIILFAHSDCEGVIHPLQAGVLADALKRLLDKMPDEPNQVRGHSYREITQKFMGGLYEAYYAREDVEFG